MKLFIFNMREMFAKRKKKHDISKKEPISHAFACLYISITSSADYVTCSFFICYIRMSILTVKQGHTHSSITHEGPNIVQKLSAWKKQSYNWDSDFRQCWLVFIKQNCCMYLYDTPLNGKFHEHVQFFNILATPLNYARWLRAT